MGIFARNRTQLSEIETGYNLDYTDATDTIEMIKESFCNDFYIFETVLNRDLLDSIDCLTEQEDSEKTISLLEKILKTEQGIKVKLNTIIESFCNKIDEFKISYWKQIEKNESDFDKADLEKFVLNDFHMFDYDQFENCNHIESALDSLLSLNIEDGYDFMVVDDDDYVLNRYSLKSSIHDIVWIKIPCKQPFKDDCSLKGKIKKLIKEKTSSNTVIRQVKQKVFDHLDKQESILKEMIKNLKKDSNDSDERKYDIVFIKKCGEIVNQLQRLSASLINSVLTEYKNIVSKCFNLYKSALQFIDVEHKKKTDSIVPYIDDVDYTSAVGEAVEYDFDIHMESLDPCIHDYRDDLNFL